MRRGRGLLQVCADFWKPHGSAVCKTAELKIQTARQEGMDLQHLYRPHHCIDRTEEFCWNSRGVEQELAADCRFPAAETHLVSVSQSQHTHTVDAFNQLRLGALSCLSWLMNAEAAYRIQERKAQREGLGLATWRQQNLDNLDLKSVIKACNCNKAAARCAQACSAFSSRRQTACALPGRRVEAAAHPQEAHASPVLVLAFNQTTEDCYNLFAAVSSSQVWLPCNAVRCCAALIAKAGPLQVHLQNLQLAASCSNTCKLYRHGLHGACPAVA